MNKRTLPWILGACLVLSLIACGGSKSSDQPAGTSPATPAADQPASVPATTGLQSIADMSNAWTALYNQNEKAINDYEGMPILALVTPATTFITSVQFDMLNIHKQDGHFEGKLMLAGYQGFLNKAGPLLTFGYDDKLAKDGFGPLHKAGDRVVASGSLDLTKAYYVFDMYTERGGKKIAREYSEFKRLGDGSMIALSLGGQAFNMRGDAELRDHAIYLHNGPGRYDFVTAKGKAGPEFQAISLAAKGDLSKEQALELLKGAGYTIEVSGGIRDGKLTLDPK